MCSQSNPSFVLWLSSYCEKDAIKHLLTIELARNSKQRQNNLDALRALPNGENQTSSKIKLKAFPFSAHYAASRTTSSDGSKAWLDSHHGTADDLSYAVATRSTNTFSAGKTGLQQPRPTATSAKHLQRVCFAAERG
jgi:hypothetical protein